jgi:TolA protein
VKEKKTEKQKEKKKASDDETVKAKSQNSPKPKSSPSKSEKNEKNEKPSASAEPSAGQAGDGKSKEKPGKGGGGTGPGNVSGSGSGDSALVGYVGILTNRFQAAWNQPTSEMALGKMLAVTVKLRVEQDGTVTQFDIVEGSGNAVVDDSVREAGKKITKLPPPPNGQAFSAPVRFELGN